MKMSGTEKIVLMYDALNDIEKCLLSLEQLKAIPDTKLLLEIYQQTADTLKGIAQAAKNKVIAS